MKHEIVSELFDIFKDLCQKIFRHKHVNQTILCRILYHMTKDAKHTSKNLKREVYMSRTLEKRHGF